MLSELNRNKMEKQANYIKRIELDGLWGRFNIAWDLRPDVNILSGINGVGKTTILNRSVSYLERLSGEMKSDEKNARMHTNLAIAYDGLNKKNAAMKELRKAIALDPNLAEARFNLAILLASMKPPKLTEAKHHYQTALQLGSMRDEKLEKTLYP